MPRYGTKTRFAIAAAAGVMLIPGVAAANHVFDDVPDDKFYAGPVEWAAENGITTGKSPTTFAPDDGVTRGESVTFLQRYHNTLGQNGVARAPLTFSTSSTTAAELTTLSVDVPAAGTLLVEIGGQYWLDLDATNNDAEWGYVQMAICDAPDSLEAADCGDSLTDARYEDPDDTEDKNATPGIATSRIIEVDGPGTVELSINGLSESGATFWNWFTYAQVSFNAGENALEGALTVGG